MFFALKRKNLANVRVGDIFAILSLCGGIFFAAILFFAAQELEKSDVQQLERAMHSYLERAAQNMPKEGIALPVVDKNALGSLSFVSFIRKREHVVFTNNKLPLSMKNIVSLASVHNGLWKTIDGQSIVVTTKKLSPHVLFQAGMRAPNYTLFVQLQKTIYILFMLYIIASLVFAKFLGAWQKAPMCELTALLTEIKKNEHPTQLPEKKGVTGALYAKINSLLTANVHLVKEIQASLDNLAHDLRTPIARLRSTAEYGLQREKKEDLQDALADCLEESEHIAAILQIMMSVAEAESGTMRLAISQEYLTDNVSAALELYEYIAEEKSISLKLEVKDIIICPIDATRMRQVWANLLDNGIKYGKVGGTITVCLWQENGKAYISFTDDGMGISEKEIPRIWERLYRGDRSRTEKGLGLGLNYVRSVIETHGGHIHVKSVLHQQTCFTIDLPLAVANNLRERKS